MIVEFPAKNFKLQDNQRLVSYHYPPSEKYAYSLHIEYFDGFYWQWDYIWLLAETYEELVVWCDLHGISMKDVNIK